ncbi:hypothetical protein G4B88_017008, partial [Cannabis sativa]
EIQIEYDPNYCLATLFLLQETNSTNRSNFPFQFKYNPTHNNHYTTYTLFHCSSDRFCHQFRLVPSHHEIDVIRGSYKNCTKMYDTRSIPDSLYNAGLKGNRDFVTLRWSTPDCRDCEAKRMGCRFKNNAQQHHYHHHHDNVECFHIPIHWTSKVPTLVVFCLMVVAASFYAYTLYKKDREQKLRVTEFLKDYFALKPSRYTYSDIKKFTNKFKNKLGEGAYGTVFKGKLSNKVLVAVKILNDSSKGNDGEEFLNEVATIGQIHHINVVRLVGYCAEGLRRALVYEFLPNGSLHNYISLEVSKNVYSFGMLLVEIVGGRNNTSETDEIYYPEWIYNLLEDGEDFQALIENEEDRKIAKKLATIGFWCIQWHPIGRPAMKTVVQMLETDEILNLPPNPFVSTTQSNTRITPSILELETIVE